MEICVLASGSDGNCIYVAGGGTRLLIDAGLSRKETAARLAQLGVELDVISGVLFTHDHADHCVRADVIHRRHALPFYANEGTAAGIDQVTKRSDLVWKIFETGSPFPVGSLQVEPFSVPHDAADAVGFVISDGRMRLGIATDLGMATTLIRNRLSDCDALILEANHDVEMLRLSGRPWSLIQRILGRQGHLSNEAAAELLASVLGPRLRVVFMAHLSVDCNTPALAENAMREVLKRVGREDIRLVRTRADAISERIEL
ncbi:MAG: MBL fold metallo-hydrolase [Kiritimatiellia bacterium]